MSAYVWTMDEIRALPEFGSDFGWFYGVVREGRRLHFGEVFPGTGYSLAKPRTPREWFMALRDIRMAKRNVTARAAASSLVTPGEEE